jgi:hypothetical protein
MLTTADSTYDDATDFDLQVYVTDTTGHDKRRSVRSEVYLIPFLEFISWLQRDGTVLK